MHHKHTTAVAKTNMAHTAEHDTCPQTVSDSIIHHLQLSDLLIPAADGGQPVKKQVLTGLRPVGVSTDVMDLEEAWLPDRSKSFFFPAWVKDYPVLAVLSTPKDFSQLRRMSGQMLMYATSPAQKSLIVDVRVLTWDYCYGWHTQIMTDQQDGVAYLQALQEAQVIRWIVISPKEYAISIFHAKHKPENRQKLAGLLTAALQSR